MATLSLLDSDLPSYNEAASFADHPNATLANSQGHVTRESYRRSLVRNDNETTYFKADSKQDLTSAEIRPVSSSQSSTHWGPDKPTAAHKGHLPSKLKQKFKSNKEYSPVAQKQRPRWLGNGSQHLVAASKESEIKDPERWRRRRHQAAKVATAVGGVALVAFLIVL